MRNTGKGTDQSQFLSGWKEIANYMGKGVRTVQRYERDLGLPVRRPAGKSTGSVVATTVEIDAWITASPIRDAFQLTRQDTSSTAVTASIRTGLSEMRRLREQMTELRNEVQGSVQVLRDSLYGLQGDLHTSFDKRPSTLLEPKQRTNYMMGLLEFTSKRKVS
jgi:hypothetical protein